MDNDGSLDDTRDRRDASPKGVAVRRIIGEARVEYADVEWPTSRLMYLTPPDLARLLALAFDAGRQEGEQSVTAAALKLLPPVTLNKPFNITEDE